jgi:uncharacterized OB-fold protein
MAKQQSFADKATKAAQMKGAKCPVCGTVYQPIKLVSSERSKVGPSWKTSERMVQVCKCNEKEMYS